MIKEKLNLALEQTFVSEIQMSFKDSSSLAAFERRNTKTDNKVFRYTNVKGSLIPTLSATGHTPDSAIETIRKMIDYIQPEIDDNVCNVIVARVYNVIFSEAYLER